LQDLFTQAATSNYDSFILHIQFFVAGQYTRNTVLPYIY